MAVYDILPSENLKYDDIRDTLNASGGTVNNDVSSAFKTTANINEASKYKPMIIQKPFTSEDADRKEVDWGFTIPTSNLSDDNLDFANPDTLGEWVYNLPVIGADYLRLGDYAGYDAQVKLERGDWGLVNVARTADVNYGNFISEVVADDIKNDLGGGIWVRMRASNPDKPNLIAPKDINMGYLGYFVYTANADVLPSWRFKKMAIDTNPTHTTTGLVSVIRYSDLGITSDNVDTIEMRVRIVAVCFEAPHDDTTSTSNKKSLRLLGIQQYHDVNLTSGRFVQFNQVNFQRSMLEGKVTVALHGNGYILPSYPEGASIKAYVSSSIKVYSEAGNVLDTISGITYVSNNNPSINSVVTVRNEFYVDDLPYNWYRLEGKFTDLAPGNEFIKCDTISITKSELGL